MKKQFPAYLISVFLFSILISGCIREETSSLDTFSWDDYSPFEDVLIEDELALHPGLRDASIYHLSLHIDESLTDITGRMQVLYTNKEDTPLDHILFTLYPNLTPGRIDIGEVTIDGISAGTEYSNNNSSMIVKSAEPILPGDKIEIGISYSLVVPVSEKGEYGGISYGNEVLSLAYSYPMIPSYDGWNNDLPARYGDFLYNDVSFYIARVTMPQGLILAAPGKSLSRRKIGNRMEVTFAMGPARDLYMAASHNFELQTGRVGDTLIQSYANKEASDGSGLVLSAASHALESYNLRFGTYPFTALTIVSVPFSALGIEFPGIVVNAERLYDLERKFSGLSASILLESTTAHEVAHQWFYATVGSDQLNEPWLDEALTQYATWLYYRDRYGDTAAKSYFNSFYERWRRVERKDIPIGLPVREYTPKEYGAIIYGRGPLFVKALSDRIEEDTLDSLLERYCRKFKWKLAKGSDFLDLAEETCTCELDDLVEEWIY